jgi:hypothetical protein
VSGQLTVVEYWTVEGIREFNIGQWSVSGELMES